MKDGAGRLDRLWSTLAATMEKLVIVKLNLTDAITMIKTDDDIPACKDAEAILGRVACKWLRNDGQHVIASQRRNTNDPTH